MQKVGAVSDARSTWVRRDGTRTDVSPSDDYGEEVHEYESSILE